MAHGYKVSAVRFLIPENRNLMLMKLFIILLFAILPARILGQFEQKFTLNFSIGYVDPFGESDYILTMIENPYYSGTYAQPYPYLMSNFGSGMVFTGGMQANYSRRFSLAFNLQFFRLQKWRYTYEWNYMDSQTTSTGSWMEWEITEADIDPDGGSENVVVRSGENKLTLNNFAVGMMPKIYLLPGRALNPYIFGDISMNITDLQLENSFGKAKEDLGIQYFEYEPVQVIFEQSVGLGLYPGIGFDLSVNDNIGLFIQSGFSFIFINDEKLDEAGYPSENFKTFKAEAGIKISFLRSKNL